MSMAALDAPITNFLRAPWNCFPSPRPDECMTLAPLVTFDGSMGQCGDPAVVSCAPCAKTMARTLIGPRLVLTTKLPPESAMMQIGRTRALPRHGSNTRCSVQWDGWQEARRSRVRFP